MEINQEYNNLDNKRLGMKWFDFFYKISIPIGMVGSLLYTIAFFITAFRDDMVYIVMATIQFIIFSLEVSIFINFRRAKFIKIRNYPIRLYYLTIAFIIVFSIMQILINIFSIIVWLIYMILNIIYFSKRKKYFNK